MLIYISLPYTGCEEQSKIRSIEMSNTILKLVPNATIVNPILNFGFVDDTVSYKKCINMCLELLDKCDIIVYEGSSKGVEMEKEKAIESWVKIFKYEDLDELVEYTSKYGGKL